MILAEKQKHSMCLLTELLKLYPLGEKVFLVYSMYVYLSQILNSC